MDTNMVDKNLLLEKEELKEIEAKLKTLKFEKETYKSLKKQLVERYSNNLLQVIGTGALLDAPIHLINSNFNEIGTYDYVILVFVLTGIAALSFDLYSETSDYKKRVELDQYHKLVKRKKELSKV